MKIARLIWDEDSVQHLWQSHQVTADEVKEVIFGPPDEDAEAQIERDGNCIVVYGETASGRLLKIVGEPHGSELRVFAARNMTKREKRAYRRR